ncbi:hypothetical protein [Lacinutrix algicola]|uniref:hypothetical protein n=1 Tax=Lacinutrix algicola TaxID=342954 RepID=UPI0006E12C3E|nr:hypothetical protein [Lacinutrix algicola]
MKAKTTLITLIFFMILSISFAQNKKKSLKLINGKVSISKYHSLDELNRFSKGDLLTLYIQRIEVIVNILPNIAFATKPNVTMASLGIPETKENIKALELNREASAEYFDSTVIFQRSILPYSDSRDLIAAILFYEETLKSLHTYNDFKAE